MSHQYKDKLLEGKRERKERNECQLPIFTLNKNVNKIDLGDWLNPAFNSSTQ